MAKKTLNELLGGVKRFGRLTAVSEAQGRLVQSTGYLRRMVNTQCDCGVTKVIAATSLTCGTSNSCGCLNRELTAARNKTHGDSIGGKRTPEYTAWKSAKARCYIKSVVNYAQYGGRGIRMCPQWRDSYETFLMDMGRRPSNDHSIDRVDPNGHYEPSNCRWAVRVVQSRNRRTALMITYKGRQYNCSEAAEKFGFKQHTLAKRIRDGWPHDKAIETPLMPGKKAVF